MNNVKLALVDRRQLAQQAIEKAVGMDAVAILALYPDLVQSALIDGTRYLDMTDVMNIFAADNREAKNLDTEFDPRKYWNRRKKSLLSKDDELSHSVGQLKLRSEDGKMRLTDVAPLWSVLLIISFLQTPISITFMKKIFKGMETGVTTAEIKCRTRNIGKGLEWKADEIHLLMNGDGQEYESPDEEIGYYR